MLKTWITVPAALLALASAGCHRQSKITITDGSGNSMTMTADEGGDHVNLTKSDGNTQVSMQQGGVWPAAMAAVVPEYPGAKVQTSAVGGVATGGLVSFTTADTPDKVVAFYKAAAAKSGMTPGMDMANGTTHMFTAAKPGGPSLTVQAGIANGQTSANLILGNGPG